MARTEIKPTTRCIKAWARSETDTRKGYKKITILSKALLFGSPWLVFIIFPILHKRLQYTRPSRTGTFRNTMITLYIIFASYGIAGLLFITAAAL